MKDSGHTRRMFSTAAASCALLQFHPLVDVVCVLKKQLQQHVSECNWQTAQSWITMAPAFNTGAKSTQQEDGSFENWPLSTRLGPTGPGAQLVVLQENKGATPSQVAGPHHQ
jgi:hypothetical protein